jgi:hypothetical protein
MHMFLAQRVEELILQVLALAHWDVFFDDF